MTASYDVSTQGASQSASTSPLAKEAHKVTLLLCTYNGAGFLEEQLTSIAEQYYSHWRIVASDDGSTDATLAILSRFAEQCETAGRVEIRQGPRKGAAANFISLAADPSIDGDFFSFCDQDDIWVADKLDRAISWLKSVPETVPALYCSRTRIVADDGRPVGLSPLFALPPSFRNAIVQSLAGGNTMVFNRAARALLISAGRVEIVSHDWWAYMLVSGAGGCVGYDPIPSLHYRQHDGNVIGSNTGVLASLRRVRMVIAGRFTEWNDVNIRALRSCEALLTPQNREVFRIFCEMRSGSLPRRLRAMWRARFYRQTTRGQIALLMAVLAKKL